MFKARGADTDGALALWESLMPRGSSPPLHVHHNEDEAFFVLDGEMTFRIGEDELSARAGAFIWAPRDIPHQFRVESDTARMITLFVPGGGEQMFFEMGSRPAEVLTLPPPNETPPPPLSDEQLVELARRYNGAVVGPPMPRP